eukprot:CAMPEP_0205826708 /NCGR_PEP_ID=MMETSP0206-20130828/29603_1 /ASSEMBLY_ACC=CAM_ASM_000279 /TAXON_ID=36767 /ORGANISM="Euplotes focardii, Strain TN1" /LENGTH=37 /DNA_ID= /DNA_START= /DNA_END= /DNA_ORIENTATION=
MSGNRENNYSLESAKQINIKKNVGFDADKLLKAAFYD